ncbi:hypothetical protein Q4503_17120 [Colwellia sp. 6_MG-2023]|uniref:hypothetical protein n=1 Tax=Colwellia sp. 6_MG-2023 TaxID=3062676 RepID=UPI0026E13F02|nr:hypothetical protein [Colwellia sp. 6_MG-2023]MDO6489419.1 hypothetical protein [Colwellia sp. 6_MG-2023]
MKKWLVILFSLVSAMVAISCQSISESENLCTDSWERFIHENIPTGDGKGHGPDLGSDEWKSVVEFKLGIRGNTNIPQRNTKAWCAHVDKLLRSKLAV